MKKNLFTYKKSGVDINAADKFIKYISKISSKNNGKKKLSSIGGFGSLTNLPKNFKATRYHSLIIDKKTLLLLQYYRQLRPLHHQRSLLKKRNKRKN